MPRQHDETGQRKEREERRPRADAHRAQAIARELVTRELIVVRARQGLATLVVAANILRIAA